MIIRTVVLLFLSLLFYQVLAQEQVNVNFSYPDTLSVDLSTMKDSMRIAGFTDSRGIENLRLITASDLGNGAAAAGYQAEKDLADIVRDAFVQGFERGGADLVETDEGKRIVGNLLASEVELVDREGVQSIQITLRTRVQLQRGDRTIWETVLFGRGVVPATEGIAAAIHAALVRTIRELVNDDYFLLEVR